MIHDDNNDNTKQFSYDRKFTHTIKQFDPNTKNIPHQIFSNKRSTHSSTDQTTKSVQSTLTNKNITCDRSQIFTSIFRIHMRRKTRCEVEFAIFFHWFPRYNMELHNGSLGTRNECIAVAVMQFDNKNRMKRNHCVCENVWVSLQSTRNPIGLEIETSDYTF